MSNTTWQRVSKRRPCPVCGRPDWCLFSGDNDNPEAAICARTESPKRCGESGWLHVLRDDGPTWSPRVRRIEVSAARISKESMDFAELAANAWAAGPPAAIERLARSLGLSVGNFNRLDVGWSAEHHAFTFPMRDANGTVVGIRLRRPDGRKLSVRSGREGLFIPIGLPSRHPGPLPKGEGTDCRLLICEGPTDTVALLDLGFAAVGRPSCTGGVKLVVELVRQWQTSPHPNPLPKGEGTEVVIVADADAPGQRGAENLAAVLVAYCRAVRVIASPSGVKDARQWKQLGATAADVLAAIDAATVESKLLQLAAEVAAKPAAPAESAGAPDAAALLAAMPEAVRAEARALLDASKPDAAHCGGYRRVGRGG